MVRLRFEQLESRCMLASQPLSDRAIARSIDIPTPEPDVSYIGPAVAGALTSAANLVGMDALLAAVPSASQLSLVNRADLVATPLTAAAPTVTAIGPTTGTVNGGTSVAIVGTNLTGAQAVTFGGVAATSFTVDSDNRIIAVTPAGTGSVDVVVTTPDGVATAPTQFAYSVTPIIRSITPGSGLVNQTTSVTINGENLSGADAVDFGSYAANIVSVSDTQITATIQAPNYGSLVYVTVHTSNGTSPETSSALFAFEYPPTNAPPSVDAIFPRSGPAAGGTPVVIYGANFGGATAVYFGDVPAASFTVNAGLEITATSPPGNPGVVNVTVVSSAGVSTIWPFDQFTYTSAAPTITAISPHVGPAVGGTSVIITGNNLSGALAVYFGDVPATNFINSDTQITATAPAGTGTVDVTVVSTGGTSATSSADQFTYVSAPIVASVSPYAGPTAGGTSVTITGANFSGATAVNFGGVAGTIVSNTDTQIVATSPAGSAGTVDVTVTTADGTSATSAADQFTYMVAPEITAITPNFGSAYGGVLVTITGTNFTGTTSVLFGNLPSTIQSVTDTSIVVLSPVEHGWADVYVITPGGTSSIGSQTKYTTLAIPTITSITPNTGPDSGGTSVTILGTNLETDRVFFGAVPGQVTYISDSQLIVSSPPGHGTVDVTVLVEGVASTASSVSQFTYFAVPTISGIAPTIGPTTGGTQVTITGTGLDGATAVNFGGAAGLIVSNTGTQIVATSPAGVIGTVDLTVTTANTVSATSSADQFTYSDAPTITSISPPAGPTSGGTQVTITGTNFTGATAVNFGSTAAASFVVDSDTQITATSPAGSIATVDVTVTTAGGASATTSSDQFEYQGVPTITSVSPASGSTSGGTTVTITGTNFAPDQNVAFGGVLAPGGYVSSTQLVTTAPANSAGTVQVTVTTFGGQATGQFTYALAPAVTSISPPAGPTSGGTQVTITGTNFTGATAVNFGSTAAASFIVDSDTQITATSPAGSIATVDVTVTTAGGASATTSSDQFEYQGVPTITLVIPASGPIGGGTTVTITGTNFAPDQNVAFGGVLAPGGYVSSTQLITTATANSAGTVQVTVTTFGGQATGQFTYAAAPTVTSIAPDTGSTSGGTQVTIAGTNFTGATAVNFGSTTAASFVVNSDTQITVTSPAGSIGTVNVTVTTPGGTSVASSSAEFDYQMATATLLTSSANPASIGHSVTFTATVAPTGGSAPMPTGTVTFTNGNTFIGSGQLSNVNGAAQATFTTAVLPPGQNPITASYSGDENFLGSTSAVVSQSIVAPVGSLAGVVFNDVKGDGVFNSDDVLLTGVILTLTSSNSSFSPLQVKTDVNGNYQFINLPPGTYSITKTQPQDLTNGAAVVGAIDNAHNGTSPNDNSIVSIQLSGGASGSGYNFTERGLASNVISSRLMLSSTPPSKTVLDQKIAVSYAQAGVPTNVPVGIASAP
jgi:hypothetical protein